MRDWTENQIMLVFLRHGATQANKERRYLGKTDESLSKEGIESLKAYKRQKLYPDVEYLFASPMKRCTETAEIIYPALCPTLIPEWEEMHFGRFEYKNYEELKDDVQYQEWLCSGGTLDFPEGESRKDFILRCKSGFLRMCKELSQTVGRNADKPLLFTPKLCTTLQSYGPITLNSQESGASPQANFQCPRGRPCAEFVTVSTEGVNSNNKPVSVGVIVHGGTIMALLSTYSGNDYFDYQVSNGRGYVCRLTGVDGKAARENDIQIKVAAEI